MNNLPHGPELLEIARETLMKEVLPNAGGEARYALLMIANAMGIAARGAKLGDPPLSVEEERTIAREIRAGDYDANDQKQSEMLARLREAVVHRLKVSNPKAIQS